MRKLLALLLLAPAASCVGPPAAPPSPPPAPAPTPTPTPPPPPSYTGDWRDWPVTPGTWAYRQDARGSTALFGAPGSNADVMLRCDRLAHAVYLSRLGSAPAGTPLTVRTTALTRQIATQPSGGTSAYMVAALAPGDNLLDAMGYSRGRFIIEQAGLPTLVVPAWAEVLRVTEDCRQ